MASAPIAAAAIIPPWSYAGVGSCEHVVEKHTTYGAEIAALVPAQFRDSWGSNDINDNAPGKPSYMGYGWRWCGTGDVAVECEHFCESLGDCVAISAGQCCFPYKARCALSELSDKSKSQSYRYYEKQRRWGAPFLSFMLAASAIYVGGGMAWAAKVGPGGRGLATHPHYGHWKGIYGLVMDGIAFVRGGARTGQRQSNRGSSSSVGREQPHDRPGKKQKKERKPGPKQEHKTKLLEFDGEFGGTPESTTAGGGGRWVHVTA